MLQDDVQTHNCSKPTTMDTTSNYHSIPVFPNLFLLAGLFWLRKITTDPQILFA